MNQKILTWSLIFILLSAPSCSLTNSEDGMIPCNEELLSRYIGKRNFNTIDNNSMRASPDIKKLCPNMQHTCCSHEELLGMAQTLSLKIKKAEALIKLFEKFIQRLSYLRSADIEILYKTSMTNSCSSFTKKEYQAALEYINKFKMDIVRNFGHLIRFDIEYNKGFVCGICIPETSLYFMQTHDGAFMVDVDVDSCLRYIPNVADALPSVIYSFHKVEVLIKTIGCEVGLPFSLDLSINHNSQKSIFEEEMRKCVTPEYILQSSKCVEFCNLGILNNFWGSFVVDVIQVANMIMTEWETHLNVGHFNEGIDGLGFSYNELKFQYFIKPLKSVTGMNIEDYSINIVNNSGWNLFNNPINIVSGLSLLRVAALALLALVALVGL